MRYKIKINDDERRLIVKALYDWRNELPTDSLLRPTRRAFAPSCAGALG